MQYACIRRKAEQVQHGDWGLAERVGRCWFKYSYLTHRWEKQMHRYHLPTLVEGGSGVRRELYQGIYEPVVVDSRLGHSNRAEASAIGGDDKGDNIWLPVDGSHPAFYLNPIRVVDS